MMKQNTVTLKWRICHQLWKGALYKASFYIIILQYLSNISTTLVISSLCMDTWKSLNSQFLTATRWKFNIAINVPTQEKVEHFGKTVQNKSNAIWESWLKHFYKFPRFWFSPRFVAHCNQYHHITTTNTANCSSILHRCYLLFNSQRVFVVVLVWLYVLFDLGLVTSGVRACTCQEGIVCAPDVDKYDMFQQQAEWLLCHTR